jgi:hypothetical protein
VEKEIMKNIHILPTDQPSRLAFDMDENFYLLCEEPVFFKHQELVENRNIYITSSEEIKEGDWILYGANQIVKIEIQIDKNSEHFKIYGMGARRKIILTTDPKLIADGVQSIDDNFLKWFVKNPTCEFVEVKEKSFNEIEKELGIYGHDIELTENEYSEWLKNGGQLYKIIIPQEEDKKIYDMPLAIHDTGKTCTTKQEEPKQESYICPKTNIQCDDECCVSAEDCHIISSLATGIVDCEEPNQNQDPCNLCGKTLREQMKGCYEITCHRQFLNKQETLEEAAINCWAEGAWDNRDDFTDGFIDGAKWQQEKMYAEADNIMRFLDTEVELKLSDTKTIERIKWYFETYFEQFKKK